MNRLTQSAITTLLAGFTIIASGPLSAFEQGTYFIYQIVDSETTPVVDKRIVVQSKLFLEAEKTQSAEVAQTDTRSEFEMDYTSLSTISSSGFEVVPATGDDKKSATDSSSFNLAPQEPLSLFGD